MPTKQPGGAATDRHERPRYLEAAVRDDALASSKMAFVSGPRQVGKSTLGRALVGDPDNVFNWDDQR
jgi:predicted AAA+ superfamily ATPase